MKLYYLWSNHQHNPFIISGNVAYKKPAQMGYGWWEKDWPADRAVDGSIDTNMDHGHCSWVQGDGPLGYSWKVDLMGVYDVETILLYSTKSECI